jgi:predicted PurR-regulated permease PerM
MNWGPDTEDISQRVEGYLQNHIPELQMQPAKKQQVQYLCSLSSSFFFLFLSFLLHLFLCTFFSRRVEGLAQTLGPN